MEIIKFLLYNSQEGEIELILAILFFLLVFITFVILIILSLPYFYQYSFAYRDNLHHKIQIEKAIYKFTYISYKDYSKTSISVFNLKKEIIKYKDEKKSEIKNKKTDSVSRGFPWKIISKDNIEDLLKFLIKIFKLIKPDDFRLDLLISLDDPYYNGLILAYYHSLKGVYLNFPVRLNINWQEEVVEGQGKIAGKIIPIVIFYHLLVFSLSPQTLKILWQIHKYYKE